MHDTLFRLSHKNNTPIANMRVSSVSFSFKIDECKNKVGFSFPNLILSLYNYKYSQVHEKKCDYNH